MKQKPGELKVLSKPSGAIVSINGEEVGKTPFSIGTIEPGKTIRVSCVKSGFSKEQKTVTVKSDFTREVNFELTSVIGGLSFRTSPAITTVYINGKLHGKTEKSTNPLLSKVYLINGLNPGTYKIKIEADRYKTTKSRSVIVGKGKITPIPNTIKLKKLWLATHILTVLKSGTKKRVVITARGKFKTDVEYMFGGKPQPDTYNNDSIKLEKIK